MITTCLTCFYGIMLLNPVAATPDPNERSVMGVLLAAVQIAVCIFIDIQMYMHEYMRTDMHMYIHVHAHPCMHNIDILPLSQIKDTSF